MDTFDKYCDKLPSWLRWILIFPASLLVYVLANILTNIAGKLLEFFSRDPWSDKLFTHLVSPGVAGFFAIAIAIALAPRAKPTVAFLITGIWLLIYGALITFAFLTGDWRSAIPGLVSAGTTIWAYVQFRSEQS
jgi:hypothetical protein